MGRAGADVLPASSSGASPVRRTTTAPGRCRKARRLPWQRAAAAR